MNYSFSCHAYITDKMCLAFHCYITISMPDVRMRYIHWSQQHGHSQVELSMPFAWWQAMPIPVVYLRWGVSLTQRTSSLEQLLCWTNSWECFPNKYHLGPVPNDISPTCYHNTLLLPSSSSIISPSNLLTWVALMPCELTVKKKHSLVSGWLLFLANANQWKNKKTKLQTK